MSNNNNHSNRVNNGNGASANGSGSGERGNNTNSNSNSNSRVPTSIPIFPLIFSEEESPSSSLSSNIINTFLHTLIQSFMRNSRNPPSSSASNLDNQDDEGIGLEVNFLPSFSLGHHQRGDFFNPHEEMDLGDDHDDDEEEEEEEEDDDDDKDEDDGGIYAEQHQLLDPEDDDSDDDEENEEEEEDENEEDEDEEGDYEYDEDYEDYDGIDHEGENYMHNLDEDNEHENDNENEAEGIDDDETDSNPFDLYEYESSYTTSTLTHYGTIGYILYRTLSRSKLYSVVDGKPFLGQLVGYFLGLVKGEPAERETTSDIISDKADSLEKLMSIIPSVEYLKQMIYKTKYTLKEAIVINCLLDLHTFYALKNSSPPYTPFLSTLLPLLRDFHTSKLSPPALRMLASQYKKVLGSVKNYEGEFKILDNRDEYKKYYSTQEKEMRNLVMGCVQTSYIR